MGSDDEQSLSDCDGSVATVNTVLDSVPVDVTRAGKLRCKLCFSLATELSPLAVSTDAHPRHLEWRQYVKIKIHYGKIMVQVILKRSFQFQNILIQNGVSVKYI